MRMTPKMIIIMIKNITMKMRMRKKSPQRIALTTQISLTHIFYSSGRDN